MSNAMGVRLVHNLTHPSDLVIDLAVGPQLARAVIAAHRRSHLHPRQFGWGREPAALIVTGWPLDDTTPGEFFARCRVSLVPGGCVAVLLPHGDVVAAGRRGHCRQAGRVGVPAAHCGGRPAASSRPAYAAGHPHRRADPDPQYDGDRRR